jgi:sialate O-acetylesterase
MKLARTCKHLLLFAALAVIARPGLCAQDPPANPFISPMFSSNMVLQRGIPIPVWGWTTPGQKVTVSLRNKTATAIADAQGKWIARLGSLPAGGPYKLTVSGPDTLTLENVLIGDVWVCSGQSNMEMGIGNVDNAQQEIASANYPNIRLFTVQKTIATSPQTTVVGNWQVCTPTNVASGGWNGFSAVAYFFGRELYKKTGVPIGLIHTSWGGTVAEAWTSAEALKGMPDFAPAVAQLEASRVDPKVGEANLAKRMEAWYRKNDPVSADGVGWSAIVVDISSWRTMSLPGLWESAGLPNYDGVVWFRKELELSPDLAGKPAMLHLGTIDDQDTTWVNGVQVGGMNKYDAVRDYKVPAGLLKPGHNVITVRVLDTGVGGGINGKPEQMSLDIPGQSTISLAGPWNYKESVPLSKTQPVPQLIQNNPNVTTVLYNGMIAPVIPYGIKGAIWYQGESNAGRAYQYRTLLPTMIGDWRSRWGEGNFPFFIVQLANFQPTKAQPAEDAWAELREAQAMTAATVKNSAIASAIDIGDAVDIHPKNKQEVGRRLALDALATVYRQKVEYSGPTYKSMAKEENAIRLTFSHVGGGLMARTGDKLTGFEIAGPDRHFVWADARIDGDTIVVSSPDVPNPTAVRYGWAINPVVNLYNKAGLPANPFRTDDYPGVTANAK